MWCSNTWSWDIHVNVDSLSEVGRVQMEDLRTIMHEVELKHKKKINSSGGEILRDFQHKHAIIFLLRL